MRKSLFSIAAVAALAGIVLVGTNLKAAAPKVTKPAVMKMADDITRTTPAGQSAGTITVLNYSTGFEAASGFTARDATCVQDTITCPGGFTGECGFIGDGTQGSGAYPEPWGVSGSNTGNIEGHVDTIHPFAGTQHLRVSKDLCDNTNSFSFSVDARIPPSPPLPGIIAPATYSGMISLDRLFGSNVNWQPQSNSQGLLTSRVMFFFYGFFYILDDPGTGLTFIPVFTYWDATGTYQNITVHHDPCAKHICDGGANSGMACPNGTVDCKACVGGANDGVGCVGDFQCPGGVCDGGSCAGRIDYSYGGNLIYTGMQYAGTTSEQFLIYTDNFPGETDVDDLVVETGAPCPTICGNNELETGEQCDGLNDDGCPGACVASGATGPGGEAECTCIIPALTCADADAAANGTNNAIAHGQWWTFTAETPAYGIELCGSSGFDSYLVMWTGTCSTLSFLAANDDCDSSTAYGPGSDPLASCFDRAGPGSVGGPYESCTCIATNAGQQYWASVYGAAAPGNTTNLTLNKRLDCATAWANGACTDCLGNCVDDVASADCTGTWVAQKLCATDAAAATCGACCDDAILGGGCADNVLAADCASATQAFSLGETCAALTPACTGVLGACCNGLDGTCSITDSAGCTGQSRTFTLAAACGDISCTAVPGACCNHINPDPLAIVGVCTDGVIQADCNALADSTWTKATVCSAVTCDATFQAIPTVSEWGLVVLTLLLLVSAKVYFGRRESATS